MTERADRRRAAVLRSAARGAAVAGMVVGGGVLLGWGLELEAVKSALPGRVTMKANTALAFLLAGASLRLLDSAGAAARRRRLARACALAVALLGIASLAEHALGWDPGIDQLVFRDAPNAVGTSSPGRMAPGTALSFAMLGTSLLLLDAKSSPARWISQLLLVATALIGLLGLAGYLYRVPEFYGIAAFTQIAFHTALTLVALAVGALLARPDRGIGAVLVSGSPGGVMARRLWPLGVVVPLLLGWLRLEGERAGGYGGEFGLALFALSNIVVFAALVWWNAELLNAADAERRRAEIEVRRLNRELEARVEERTAELAAANRELEAFAYSVSHDLRAPLRHLDGFARLLGDREGERLDETSRHYVETIHQSSARMGRLVDDLLHFSRMSRAALRTEPVELGRLVEEARQELAPAVEGRRIDWAIGALPAVEADPDLLRLVWVNLLANAIKFTARSPKARIEIGARDGANGEAVIFVRDNGVGFDPTYADKLFGVFQRLHRDEDFPGTGIGLATAQRIVHRHGGRVWAEGEVDRGATFYFSVKAVRRDAHR